jgi:hypothetical protein
LVPGYDTTYEARDKVVAQKIYRDKYATFLSKENRIEKLHEVERNKLGEKNIFVACCIL